MMARISGRQWTVWAGRVLLAIVFLATGSGKLSGSSMMIEVFGKIGFGQWFRIVTGAIEVGGAIGLLITPVAWLAAVLLCCVSIGATAAQAFVLHLDVIHTIVLAFLTGGMAWLLRPRRA